MMNKIITEKTIKTEREKLTKENQTLVLVGGCFDILHIGHIIFLEKAKQAGDILLVMLENDEQIRKMKGRHRPYNSQADRARILCALSAVDYVLPLPLMENDASYDYLVSLIKPDIIAATVGDNGLVHKKRQANLTDAKLLTVTHLVKDQSTSRLAALLEKDI